MADSRQPGIPLIVERLVFGGAGIGRLGNGKICFVRQVIPGERVKVRLRTERASYVEAELEEIIEASPDRVAPGCLVYGQCGGCHYQHISYPLQLVIKGDQVREVLRRMGGVSDPPVEPVLPSPLQYGYRNRITVHSKSGRTGFFGARSRRIVDVPRCPIASDRVNALLAQLRKSHPSDGEHFLAEPAEFRGFRQVNDAAAAHLLDRVREMASPGGRLLVDAYCGAGFFAKHLADRFESTIGIEWSPDAVRSARRKTGSSEVYLLGDVKDHLVSALEAAPPADTTLLLDPPQEGVDEEVLAIVMARQPSRLIYVSCNPPTLARDIKRMNGGFGIRRVCPVDMFPQTAEIEVAALLEKI
jgi:tRNA/tmRNA/rRNA uracil-C5-methylase (TrmA/RlmC/RlmD family)